MKSFAERRSDDGEDRKRGKCLLLVVSVDVRVEHVSKGEDEMN